MEPIVALILIAALLIGIGLGWYLGSRSLTTLRDELVQLVLRRGDAARELLHTLIQIGNLRGGETILNAQVHEQPRRRFAGDDGIQKRLGGGGIAR